MRQFSQALAVGCLLSLASVESGAGESGPLQVMEAFESAWNSGDIKAMVALHTDDAEYINAGSGHYWRGKEELLKGWQAVRANSGPVPAPRTRNIRQLNADAAVIVSIYEVGPPAAPGSVRFIASTILTRHGDKWLLSHGQGTLASSPGETN